MKKEGLADSKGITKKGMEWLENQFKEMAASLRKLASTAIEPNSS
jgi:predicted transcriptional regulator